MKLTVVLDTSVIVRDFRLQGAAFGILLDAARRRRLLLMVPEVVIEEATEKYREELAQLSEQSTKLAERLGRLVGRKTVSQFVREEVEVEVARYRQHLADTLKGCGGSVIPVPETSHRDAMRREMQKRKPFNAKGGGYRDYLIWQSVLTVVKMSGVESVTFATANHRDFADGGVLHPDLALDLAQLSIDATRLSIAIDFNQLLDAEIKPLLVRSITKPVSEVVESERQVLREWVIQEAQDWVENDPYSIRDVLGLPQGHVAFRDARFESDVFVRFRMQLTAGDEVKEIAFTLMVAVDVDISSEDYATHAGARELMGDNVDPDESAWTASVPAEIRWSATVRLRVGQDSDIKDHDFIDSVIG